MDDSRQCTAHSKQSGTRCRRAAIPGGAVCVMHGGSAPQVKQAAAVRLAALVDPAITELAGLLHDEAAHVRLATARDILDRAGHGAPRRVALGGDREADPIRVELSRLSDTDLDALAAIADRAALSPGNPD